MPFFSFLLFSLSFHQKWKKINLQSKLQLYFGKSSTQNHFIGIPILKPHLSGIAPVSTSNFGRFDPIWTKFGLNLTQPGTAPIWYYTSNFGRFDPDLDQIWLKFDPIWNCTCLLELHLHTWILKNNR